MLKLYPVAMLPILGAWAIARRDRAGLGRLVLGWTAVVVLVMAAAWAVAGPASLDWLRYPAERGLQLESLGAGLLLGLHALVSRPVEIVIAYGSVQVQSPGSDLLVAASPFVLAALLAAVTGVAFRRFRSDFALLGLVPRSSVALASGAAIAAVLVSSKVLSVQYVLWLLPLVPLLPNPLRWLALVIAALSTGIYTVDYEGLWRLETPMILALVARNALLAGFAAWLLAELWGWGPGRRTGGPWRGRTVESRAAEMQAKRDIRPRHRPGRLRRGAARPEEGSSAARSSFGVGDDDPRRSMAQAATTGSIG
jgi:hypothetical protein